MNHEFGNLNFLIEFEIFASLNHLEFKTFLIFSSNDAFSFKIFHVRIKMRLNIKVIIYFVKSFIVIKICFS